MTPRLIGAWDAGWLATLHAAVFERPWSEAELRALMANAGVAGLATDAGLVLIRIVGAEAEVLTLGVRPEARSAGQGRQLLQAALTHAAAEGARAVFLEVAADNLVALSLYEGAGFARIGTRRGYYPRPDGSVVDALTLRCALNSPAP